MKMNLRRYHSNDWVGVVELLYDTVHAINSADYSETQLNAWMPKDKNLPELKSRISQHYSVVAENDKIIIGFGSVNGLGYFDCLYTHKDYQRMGIATLIADDIERYFSHNGVQVVTTDASIPAKPFFENRGYTVLYEKSIECRGQNFINYKMQKILV
jgi:putative acetyltransferase